jgi:hypothetical protein
MKPYSFSEIWWLTQSVPSLDLPALVKPTQEELAERAALIGYGENELCPRVEDHEKTIQNLECLCMMLGVIPATREEVERVIR